MALSVLVPIQFRYCYHRTWESNSSGTELHTSVHGYCTIAASLYNKGL